MSRFSYVALDGKGRETRGTLSVRDQTEAIARIKEMGYFPTKIVEQTAAADAARPPAGPAKPRAGLGRLAALNIK
ncbi:MAG: type II secretion system F family protein, partial [Verrucomicrobiota bacterium]